MINSTSSRWGFPKENSFHFYVWGLFELQRNPDPEDIWKSTYWDAVEVYPTSLSLSF